MVETCPGAGQSFVRIMGELIRKLTRFSRRVRGIDRRPQHDIEEAARQVGQEVSVLVTNSLQTSAGRMIFAKLAAGD